MFVHILLGAVSLICILIFIWYCYWFSVIYSLGNIKGPRPVPIVGHAFRFPNSAAILSELLKITVQYGGVVKSIIGFQPSLIITDCNVLEKVMNSSVLMEKSLQYRYFKNWLGNGLLISQGQKWKQRRKIITPAYHFKILEQFVGTFDVITDKLIEKLESKCGETFDVYPLITLYSLDVICETAMGTTVNAQENNNTDYVISVKAMCKIIMDRTFSPIHHYDFLYKFTHTYREEKKSLKVSNSYTMSVIKHRRQELGKTNFIFDTKKKIAFLDLLLQSSINGDYLTDEDIREEVSTFMFEGHDTTASALSFTLYSLANNLEVQDKVYEELQNIMGPNLEETITYGKLQDMSYLHMVIKEVLRLYPSVPLYARRTIQDTKISDTLTIPKNFTINIFAFGVHRKSEYYPEPEKFDPERFTLENCSKRHPFSYIPFSAGPRNCIGQKFAMLEIKTAICKILKNFVLRPAVPEHKLHLVAETILKSSNGIKIKLLKR